MADIFQAMVQVRPYRQGPGNAEVSDFIRRLPTTAASTPAWPPPCWPTYPRYRQAASPTLADLPG